MLERLARHPAGVGFAAVVIATLILPWTGLVASLDLKIIDQQAFFLRAYAPRTVINDVVVVGIDEETDKVLREPYTLWHPHLGNFFKAIGLPPMSWSIPIVSRGGSRHGNQTTQTGRDRHQATAGLSS
ncbi:MAG: hypothetical protein VCD50_10375, partial [Alphaproteobacteria bacterium]